MINQNFVLIGVLLEILGYPSYIYDTVKGKVKPNRVTWLLWSIAPLVAFFAEIKQGVGILSLTTFVVGFMPILVFIFSFVNKEAEWKLGKFDFICGILSILGLILWYITKVGNIAIIFSIFADGLASLPTIVKSYKHPETEIYLPYLLTVANAIIGLFTITKWNFQSYAFPLYLIFGNLLIAILIKFKIGKR